MRYVASREEMQDIDAYSINNVGIPGIVLMEKAALALEEVFLERIPTDSRVLLQKKGIMEVMDWHWEDFC